MDQQWILFVSPFESSKDQWECVIFENEKSLNDYIYIHDLTKEWYATTTDEMVDIIRKSGSWE